MSFLSRALRRFSAIIRYMFLNACRDRIVSSVPSYLNLCWNNSVSGNLGSRPNMIKNGLSRECSLGRKLYAAVARVHTSSHSTLGLTCLAKHVSRRHEILLFSHLIGAYKGVNRFYVLLPIPWPHSQIAYC